MLGATGLHEQRAAGGLGRQHPHRLAGKQADARQVAEELAAAIGDTPDGRLLVRGKAEVDAGLEALRERMLELLRLLPRTARGTLVSGQVVGGFLAGTAIMYVTGLLAS